MWGRPVLLTDCDASTRAWCAARRGTSEAAPELQRIALDFAGTPPRPPDAPPPRELPIGDEAETLANATRLIPRAAARIAVGGDGAAAALRFGARLLGPLLSEADAERRFVVTFFPSDGSLAVFEPPPPRRNSGLAGGAFADRRRVARPGGAGPLDCYGPADLRLGAALVVSARVFRLDDTDEATLRAMEAAPAAFPAADAARARRLLAGALAGVSTPEAAAASEVFEATLQSSAAAEGGEACVTARQLHAALAAALPASAALEEAGGLHAAVTLVRAAARASSGGGSSGGGAPHTAGARPAAAVDVAAPLSAVLAALVPR